MTLEDADFFDHRYSNFNQILSIVGLSPYQDSSKRLRHACVITILVMLGLLIETFVLLKSGKEVRLIGELLQNLLLTLSIVSRYYTILYNLTNVRKSLDQIRNDWKKLKSEEELIVMKGYVNMNRLCCTIVAYMFNFYCTIFIFPSLVSIVLYFCDVIDDNQLVLPVYNKAFASTKLHYFCTFLLEVIIINVLCKIGIAYCAIFILYTQHICAMFDIVTIRIQEPFKRNPYKFEGLWSDPSEKEQVWIITVIRSYNDVINFVELIQLLYKNMYILDVFFGFLCIILDFIYFFEILEFIISTHEVLKNCVYIISSILIIFAYSYYGQKLIDHSNKIHTTCCLVPFYALPMKINKLLIILIIRTMKPCCFSISGLAVASHGFFAKLIKASFSFATLCYKMQ